MKKQKKDLKTFRLRTKVLYLTYAKCNLSPLEVRDLLKTKLVSYVVKDIIVSRELHADGTPHIHVFLKCKKTVDIKRSDFLDLDSFHGNYQSARNAGKTVEYILKDVEYVDSENIYISESYKNFLDENLNVLDVASASMLLAEKGQIKEALNLFRAEKPMVFIKSHMSLERSLRSLYLKQLGAEAKFDFKKFNLPDGLIEKLALAKTENKTVYLQGHSGTGKLAKK